MGKPFIGLAEPAVGMLEQPESGVKFRLPYGGGEGFDILLTDSEIDNLFGIGLMRLLGQEAISGFLFDYDIRLPLPELPVFIGIQGITTEANKGHRQNVSLELGVATMSGMPENEHIGTLKVKRDALFGGWEYSGWQEIELIDPDAETPKRVSVIDRLKRRDI